MTAPGQTAHTGRAIHGYGPCPHCNYSAAPDEVLGEQRKHFWPHSLRCIRCGYATETKRSWYPAIQAWNRRNDTLAALKTAEQMVAEGRYDEAEDVLHIAISKAEGRTDV